VGAGGTDVGAGMTEPQSQHLLYRLAAGAGTGDDQRRAGVMILELSARAARLESETMALQRICAVLAVVVLLNVVFAAHRLIELLS